MRGGRSGGGGGSIRSDFRSKSEPLRAFNSSNAFETISTTFGNEATDQTECRDCASGGSAYQCPKCCSEGFKKMEMALYDLDDVSYDSYDEENAPNQ